MGRGSFGYRKTLKERALLALMLRVGMKAPEFSLLDAEGKERRLSEFLGKTVVLYFYPKDDTPGCTVEAGDFRDAMPVLKKQKVVVLGVSPDSVASHARFAEKYQLPFVLLADPEKKVLQLYGAWGERSLYGKKYFGVIRSTVVIDPAGRIQQVYPNVKAGGHVERVLKDLLA